MITITKEKNILRINEEDTNQCYAIDINSGVFFGKSGNPIKTYPVSKHSLLIALRTMKNELGYVLNQVINKDGNKTAILQIKEHIKAFMGADKIDSLNLNITFHYSLQEYAFINNNFTAFIKYINKIKADGAQLDFTAQRNFRCWCLWEKVKPSFGQYANSITTEMYSVMTFNGINEYSAEEWGVIGYYLVRCRLFEYDRNSVTKIQKYISLCRAMQKTPNRQSNFIREYLETEDEYKLRKTEFDNNIFRQNYAKKANAFDFTFGDFSVVVPKETKDIIDEGINMHHCVGRYVNDIIEGYTYIVFVRKTDTPNKCYITCEVCPSGEIGQYFLAYDRYITSADDIAFKKAFEKHLKENW